MSYEISSREIGRKYNWQIAGMRELLDEVFVRNAPKRKADRRGYMLALYLIRNNFLPPAYCRSEEMWNLGDRINVAIARLTTERDGMGGMSNEDEI